MKAANSFSFMDVPPERLPVSREADQWHADFVKPRYFQKPRGPPRFLEWTSLRSSAGRQPLAIPVGGRPWHLSARRVPVPSPLGPLSDSSTSLFPSRVSAVAVRP